MNKHVPQVTIIGAGIVNLITAYYLSKKGYTIQIIDKTNNPFSNIIWIQQGATYGGENARMYSLTEADNYNEKSSKIYSNMTNIFENSIQENGWRVLDEFGEAEKEWIKNFKAVDSTSAKTYSKDIYNFNILSGTLWKELIRKEKSIFENTNLKHGIIRIYSDRKVFNAAQKLHKKLGSFIKAIEEPELSIHLPCYQNAIKENMLGGVMKVKGFTLQIHDLCKNLINYLQKEGVVFYWNRALEGVIKNAKGEVIGIKVEDEIISSKYIIISIGAYAGSTFDNLLTKNKIHGVLGIWLSVPNVYNLQHSFKIHKQNHVGEDTNVTLVEVNGQKKLTLGSGYGYLGKMNANNVSIDLLKPLYESLIQTTKTYFREAYEESLIDNSLFENWKYCVRPFTPNGLGVFEVINNVSGGNTIITGGHNTGGFTQSPIIANSILEFIQNKHTTMATLYHPDRKN